MHNGYFYPDDVIIKIIDGKRVARVGWELPTIWTDGACRAAERDFVAGWEMARMAHRDAEAREWLQRVYPEHFAEDQRFRDFLKTERSVTAYHMRAA